MEPIESGAVSGTLPEMECFAVHYPGYPTSTSRAIETLGGLEEIGKKRSSAARRSENRNDGRLELRFRPEDPYCHPAFGDLRPCSGLLLKITKKRRKKKRKINQEDKQVSVKLSCSIVARVHDAYNFDCLADYQFIVPVHAAKARQAKRRGDEEEAPIDNGGMIVMEQDEMFMLVPKLFSTKDKPEEILLKPSSGTIPKDSLMHQALAEHNWEMSISPCLKLSYKIEEIPTKVNWEDHIPIDSLEWECQMAISKLFEERPIWPRWSMLERLLDDDIPVSYNLLRRLLPRSGYYFATGPFGQFWISRGYDPRMDPESRIYQRVELRLRDLLPNYGDTNADADTKQRWKDICNFRIFPKKSCTLQLLELDDDFIREKISEIPLLPRCMHSTGWFSKPTFELLSLRVKIKFLSNFPEKGTRKLLKSLQERFEKMKWLEAHNREQGHDENNKYLPPGAESEEEGEEEYDGDNADCSLAAISGIIGDSVNNCFLQELLGNKIIDEHGNADMGSDEEYQIYEQDSDDDDD